MQRSGINTGNIAAIRQITADPSFRKIYQLLRGAGLRPISIFKQFLFNRCLKPQC